MKASARSGTRSAAAITGSVVVFSLLVEAGGLILATAAAAFVASLGSPDVKIRDALILSAGLAIAMALLFVGLLDQSFTLLPGL